MLRLLHTADVHLGARHADLGEQAAAQRERQFAAFRATVDLALAEKVDAVLVAGDLFDSNTQPRRSVERVAAELRRLAEAAIRTVIIPGTHDVYDRASVYRAYDLPALAGLPPASDRLVVLTPDRPDVVLGPLDLAVHGRVFATKRAPRSPLAGFDVAGDDRATWHVGMIHGSLSIPGKTEHDEVVFTSEEVAASHLDYLALGHWHSTQRGRAGATLWAYSGAPEPVAVDQDRAGNVLLVTLAGARRRSPRDRRGAPRRPDAVRPPRGRRRGGRQPAGARRAPGRPRRSRTSSSTSALIGVRPDDLDLVPDEVERELGGALLPRPRPRRLAGRRCPTGPCPRPTRSPARSSATSRPRSPTTRRRAATTRPTRLRDALRLARLLLDGHEVTL